MHLNLVLWDYSLWAVVDSELAFGLLSVIMCPLYNDWKVLWDKLQIIKLEILGFPNCSLCYGVCVVVLFFLGKMLCNFMLGTQSTQRSSCKASGKTLFWPTMLTFHCCGLQHKIRRAQLCCCGDPLWKRRLPKVVYFHLNLPQVVWSMIIL